jgi:predicted MFS family arabinose efflux permease
VRAQRASFIAVNGGYLAVTCAESLLAPVFPIAARELGLDLKEAGFAFALLAASIAIGNLVGGVALARLGPRSAAVAGPILAAAGGSVAASSSGWPLFLVAQAILGLGSGIFFASGLTAAGDLAGDRRRGLAMGFFGVAFSGGLALAALLVAVAGADRWRSTFWVSAGICVVAALAIAFASMPPRAARPDPTTRAGLRRALHLPLLVGGMASGSQYGTVSFLPAFAVGVWGLSPSSAAVMLAVARVLSIPGKVQAGNRADRRGALVTAGTIGLLLAGLGAWWTLSPTWWIGVWAAIAFASGVSALGPVANVLALEAFGGRGFLLGVFRSAQIGIGALTSAILGAASEHFGMRPTLAVAAIVPVVLAILARRRPASAPGPVTDRAR